MEAQNLQKKTNKRHGSTLSATKCSEAKNPRFAKKKQILFFERSFFLTFS